MSPSGPNTPLFAMHVAAEAALPIPRQSASVMQSARDFPIAFLRREAREDSLDDPEKMKIAASMSLFGSGGNAANPSLDSINDFARQGYAV